MKMQIFIPVCYTFYKDVKINIIISEFVIPAKPDYAKAGEVVYI